MHARSALVLALPLTGPADAAPGKPTTGLASSDTADKSTSAIETRSEYTAGPYGSTGAVAHGSVVSAREEVSNKSISEIVSRSEPAAGLYVGSDAGTHGSEVSVREVGSNNSIADIDTRFEYTKGLYPRMNTGAGGVNLPSCAAEGRRTLEFINLDHVQSAASRTRQYSWNQLLGAGWQRVTDPHGGYPQLTEDWYREDRLLLLETGLRAVGLEIEVERGPVAGRGPRWVGWKHTLTGTEVSNVYIPSKSDRGAILPTTDITRTIDDRNPLYRWSQITMLEYLHQVTETHSDPFALRYIFCNRIWDPATQAIVNELVRTTTPFSRAATFREAAMFAAQTDQGSAVIGTPMGYSIANLLTENKHIFEPRAGWTITGVKIFRNDAAAPSPPPPVPVPPAQPLPRILVTPPSADEAGGSGASGQSLRELGLRPPPPNRQGQMGPPRRAQPALPWRTPLQASLMFEIGFDPGDLAAATFRGSAEHRQHVERVRAEYGGMAGSTVGVGGSASERGGTGGGSKSGGDGGWGGRGGRGGSGSGRGTGKGSSRGGKSGGGSTSSGRIEKGSRGRAQG